jgi:hypothetical protein
VSAVRVLSSAAELVDATGAHPVAVLDVGAGFVGPAFAVGSTAEGAVVFPRRSDHGVPGSAALGTASGLARLLDDPAVQAAVTGGGQPAPQRAARPHAGGREAPRPRQPRG